jgi:hypothetical protein
MAPPPETTRSETPTSDIPTDAEDSTAKYAQEELEYFQNITSQELATAIFRGGKVVGSQVGGPYSPPQQWRSAAMKVIRTFNVYHLEVDPPFSSFWDATNLGSSPKKIPNQQATLGRSIKFCCGRCKNRGIWSLLGIGECQTTGQNHFIEMTQVFYHDKDCGKSAKGKLPSKEFEVFDFDFDEVIGDTYDAVVKKLQNYNFHDRATQPMPPGHSIDFGFDNYNYDDRAYEYMPSPRYSEVDPIFHRWSMVRGHFLMAVELNMALECAHTVLDLEVVKKRFQKGGGKGKFETCPEKINTECHLSFNEISLLFGGHCMLPPKGNSKFVVDQIVHKDGETREGEIQSTKKLKGKHKPGSFIFPLEDFRTIFVHTPDMLVHAKKGQYIWFHGALPHGGKTYKAKKKDGNDWRPAIHGHLDSKHHKRKRGDFNLEESERVYTPLEHVKFMTDLFPVLNNGDNITKNALELISERTKHEQTGEQYLGSLSLVQRVRYNSQLCGQHLELEILPVSTPLLDKQLMETATRMNELLQMVPYDPPANSKAAQNRLEIATHRLDKVKEKCLSGEFDFSSLLEKPPAKKRRREA